MIQFLVGILLFVLIVVCLFMVFMILLQRGSSQGGMGTAFGGGMAESTFGAETGNILTKATVFAAVTFFVLSLGLYLLIVADTAAQQTVDDDLDLVTPSVEEAAPGEVEETLPEAVEDQPVEGDPANELPDEMPESVEPLEDDVPLEEEPAPASS